MRINNRFVGLSVLGIGLNLTPNLVAGPMGPPAAGSAAGQFGAGVEYSYGELGLKIKDGQDNTGTPVPGYEADPFKVQTVAATVGYGILERWEIGAKGGITWGEWDLPGNRFDGDVGPYVAGFTRATFYQRDRFKLGGVVQFDWSQIEGDNWGDGWRGEAEVDFLRLRIGLGATYEVSERFTIYAGPFFQYLDGEKKYEDHGPYAYSEKYDVEARSNWGGLVGGEAKVSDNARVGVDFQLTGHDWIAGLFFRWLW